MKINVIVLERKILPEYMYFKSTFIRKDFTWNLKEQLLVMHNLSFLFSVIVFGVLGVGVSFAVRKLGGTVLQVHMWFSVYTNLSKRTLYKLRYKDIQVLFIQNRDFITILIEVSWNVLEHKSIGLGGVWDLFNNMWIFLKGKSLWRGRILLFCILPRKCNLYI